MVFNPYQSLVSASATDSPTRLIYRLKLSGQQPQIHISAHEKRSSAALTDDELRNIMPKLHALDVPIVQELRSGTIMGQIGPAALAKLLPLLEKRRSYIADERLRIAEHELFPRIKIDSLPGKPLCLIFGLNDRKGQWVDLDGKNLIAGSQAYLLENSVAKPIASPGPWHLARWAKAPILELRRGLHPQERDQLVQELAEAGVPASDLEKLAIQRGTPEHIILRIIQNDAPQESPLISVQLFAEYRGNRFALNSRAETNAFVILDCDEQGIMERDLEAEHEARQQVQQLGFRFDRSKNAFFARGEKVLAALDPKAGLLPPHWIIEQAKEAPKYYDDLEIIPHLKMVKDKGLFELSLQIYALQGDERVADLTTIKDVLKWMHSGKQYLKLKDEKFVAPSAMCRQTLTILEHLGADTEQILISPLCIGLLQALGETTAMEIADQATKAWIEELLASDSPQEIDVPKGLKATLRTYQRHGLNWLAMLHRHRLTGILADDMGLGKTVQTLALLLYAQEREQVKRPSIVVAPTSVIGVWRDEAARFTPSLKVGYWYGTPEERRKINVEDYDFIVTSYGILRRDAEVLSKTSFQYIILDEAQSTKNAKSQNAKTLRLLKSERRLALTGTPIENKPEDLWSVFDFLAPGFLGNLRRFRELYARPIDRGEKTARRLLRTRIAPLVLRRLKDEVAKELPPKIEVTMRCDMLPAQRKLYDELANKLRASVQQKIADVGVQKVHLDVLAALTRLRQVCCDPALLPGPKDFERPPSAKTELFEELMREALDSNRRIVVFSQFVSMQKRLIPIIKKLGVNPLWLHGGTKNRDKVVKAFQDPDGPPVIVVSLKAGGTGVTLTRADTVMHFEPWWNPAVEHQATDRTHRLGQKQQVTVYRLICRQSIEERVFALAQRKEGLAKELLGAEGESGAKRIKATDVLELLGI
ncbi:MAG: DEAD/DEAH box helicase [Myxococcota bacterium]|jgi:superfamily II DNA or RNA helicase|nr:DEAD/DEAH box helicase [Myxococcota bacterium]